MIYFDYAASTPVDKDVLNEYVMLTKHYGNPNSVHSLGLESLNLVNKYTENIATILGVDTEELIYTSGASESNNLAIKGCALRYKNFGKHILISSLEHNSVTASALSLQQMGFEVELIPINKNGLIDCEILKKMIRNDTILVSVCAVDSEMGLVQPIKEIAEIVQDYQHCIFHTDATQAVGKVFFDFTIPDLVTLAPHKFYGLCSSGLLIKKKNVSLVPQIDGGRSTSVYRSGTPDLPMIGAMCVALNKALTNIDKNCDYVTNLSNKIKTELREYENVILNSRDNSISYTINFSLKGMKSLDIQKKLNEYDIIVGTKTSCCPVLTPSKLVYALTKDKQIASSSIRLSISYLTTEKEVNTFLEVFDKIYREYYGEV